VNKVAIEKKRIIMQQTPQEEIEKAKVQELINDKDKSLKDIRSKLAPMQKPLEVYFATFY
jgi:hypothetical protein